MPTLLSELTDVGYVALGFADNAETFAVRSKKLRKRIWWKNAKTILVTVLIVVVVAVLLVVV
jgi:hypothetical protein